MKIELFEDDVGSVEYISHMGTDLSVVNAARVSFGIGKTCVDEKDVKLIKYLMKHNHTSPFEHCVVTMKFTVPLFIRSQHHRHRTWAYNEISRRYTSVDMRFYEPRKFRTQHESNRQASQDVLFDPDLVDRSITSLVPRTAYYASQATRDHHRRILELYETLLGKGVCREQARGVLPQNLYTEYYGTASLHNILKFITLRSHHGAQWEIQQVAQACLKIVEDFFPISVKAYKNKNLE